MDLRGRRVTVMGLGRSGQAAARLARDLGARVLCTDRDAAATAVEGAENVLGHHRTEDFTEAHLVVVSPGIPASYTPVQAALAAGVEVLGELAFAWEVLRARPLPVVAVTGTNGKSSVVSFTGQLLEQAGRRAFVGGNIGRPLSLLAHARVVRGEPSADVAVVEVSSYQLELPGTFAPGAGAILNLTPDHLARHGTMAVYAEHKLRLFARCGPEDTAVLPPGQPLLPLEAVSRGGAGPGVLWLGGQPGAVCVEGEMLLSGTPDDGILSLARLQLLGDHNRVNMAAAVLMAVAVGARREALRPALVRPLAHRLERVHEARAVWWVNDSKATNVEAAVAGLSSVPRPLVAILGGQGKEGADYAPLRPLLAERARAVLLVGEAAPLLSEALHGLVVEVVGDLAAAVSRARTLARPGDAVVLSPACASFDQFRDFEHRGEVFASLARGEHPEVAT